MRKWFFLVFAGCLALLAYALWMQEVDELTPCPLCILQRLVYVGIAFFALLAFVHNPARTGRLVYTVLVSLVAVAGIAIAGRHVWLQHLPADRVPDCGPGLEYMLDVFPLMEALTMIFTGSGSCAEVSWRFLGLSIPEWTLTSYIVILLGTVWIYLRSRNID